MNNVRAQPIYGQSNLFASFSIDILRLLANDASARLGF